MCWLLILQDSTTGCTGGAPKSDLWGETEGAPFGVLGKGCGWSAKGACRGERFFAPTFLIRVGSHLAPPAWPRRRSYGRSPRFGPGLRPRGKPAQPSGYTAPLPLSRGTPHPSSLDGAPSPPHGIRDTKEGAPAPTEASPTKITARPGNSRTFSPSPEWPPRSKAATKTRLSTSREFCPIPASSSSRVRSERNSFPSSYYFITPYYS